MAKKKKPSSDDIERKAYGASLSDIKVIIDDLGKRSGEMEEVFEANHKKFQNKFSDETIATIQESHYNYPHDAKMAQILLWIRKTDAGYLSKELSRGRNGEQIDLMIEQEMDSRYKQNKLDPEVKEFWESWYVVEGKEQIEPPSYYDEIEKLEKGGRLKSAINRDRKYVSLEKWEQRYLAFRKSKARYYKEDGGPIGEEEGFYVWNETDGVFAFPTTFDSVQQAEEFIKDYREGYRLQGYYKTSSGDRIKPEDIVLSVIPAEHEMLRKGGRLKSALMRDRKYVSQEDWEQRYKKFRKSRPKYYMDKGGDIPIGDIYIHDGKEYTEQELIDFADGAAEYDKRDAMINSGDPEEYAQMEIKTIDQAIAFLGKDDVVKKMAGGGDINSLSPEKFYSSINPDLLTSEAKKYLETQILTDPDLAELSSTDEFFIDNKNLILQNFPNALSKAETGKSEQEEIKEAIELLKEMLPDLKGKDKAEAKEAIELLSEMIMLEKGGPISNPKTLIIEEGIVGEKAPTILTYKIGNKVTVSKNGPRGQINRSGAILCRDIEAKKIMAKKDEVSAFMKSIFGEEFKELYIASTDDLSIPSNQKKRDAYFKH